MLRTLRRRDLIEEDLAKSSKMQHLENKDKWHFCKGGSFSNGESPRTLPLKELHSTSETIMWRDPGGSWACLPPVYHLFTPCLPPVYDCVWNHLATGCDVHYTQKAHYERNTGNANQNKTTRRTGYKKVYPPPPPPPKHSELKEPHEMLNKAKTLTIAR